MKTVDSYSRGFRTGLARLIQAVLLDSAAQGLVAHAERLGRLSPIPLMLLECGQDAIFLGLQLVGGRCDGVSLVSRSLLDVRGRGGGARARHGPEQLGHATPTEAQGGCGHVVTGGKARPLEGSLTPEDEAGDGPHEPVGQHAAHEGHDGVQAGEWFRGLGGQSP